MCQIQLVKRFDNKPLTKRDIEGFTNLMYYGSMHNDDAHGVFCEEGLLFKKAGKLEYQSTYDSLKLQKVNMLVGHNRLKTQGSADKMDNNHPFDSENFLVVHNGVLRNDTALKAEYRLDYTVETDSYIISALMEHFFKETGDVVESIKKVASELYGSYSVMIYHKSSGRIFYFKDKMTDFFFSLVRTSGGDLLVGSTDKDNIPLSFSKIERGLFNIPLTNYMFEPEEFIIYEVTKDELVVIGKFEECSYCRAHNTSSEISYSKSQKQLSLKALLKTVADELEDSLEKSHKLIVLTRSYDPKNKGFSMVVKGGLMEAQRIFIEEETISWGTADIRESKNSIGDVLKTTITLELDSDVIADYFSGHVVIYDDNEQKELAKLLS